MHETGKRGFDPLVGFCAVLIPSKGIRRDIAIMADQKLRRRAELLRRAVLFAGQERAQFGAMQAALVDLVVNQPYNDSSIGATALVLHEWTHDPYFVVEGYFRHGGTATDYTKLDATSEADARSQIDSMPSMQIIRMMQVVRGDTEHV